MPISTSSPTTFKKDSPKTSDLVRESKQTSIHKRKSQSRKHRSLEKNNTIFVIDEFLDNQHTKTPYPNHIVVLGSTQCGKSSLIAKILDSIDEVYSFSKPLNGRKKMIIISPMNYLEISDFMQSRNEWTMTLYSSLSFSQNLISEIKNQFSESDASIKILLIDDFFCE